MRRNGDNIMLNVAVVGTGNIAPAHVGALLTFPERCKIVALCDIYPEKAEAMKARFGLDCEIFDDHEKMLASGLTIDVVHVCTPPYTHAEIAINSMNAKKHVVVEKPMATCLAECDLMLEAEQKNSVTMCCIAQNRFVNPISKLKALVDSGKAGKPLMAHVNSLWWRGHCYYDLWWRGLWEKEGGGCTLNHAVHHIDMINWFRGELPVEITSVLSNVAHDNAEIEDLSFSILRYADGFMADITASVVHHGEEQGLVFQCEHAKLETPFDVFASISRPNGFPIRNESLESVLRTDYDAIPPLPYEGHTGEIDNFMSAIENGTHPMITGADGRRTVELITAIYKSGSLKRTVSLPITPDDEFYTFEGLLKNAPHFYEKSAAVENFGDGTITLGNYKK